MTYWYCHEGSRFNTRTGIRGCYIYNDIRRIRIRGVTIMLSRNKWIRSRLTTYLLNSYELLEEVRPEQR